MSRRWRIGGWGLGAALVALVGTTAEAGTEVDLSGEIRVRYEADGKSFDPDHVADFFTLQRTRLQAKATTEKGAVAVIELQDSRRWGDEGGTIVDGESVDLYQGYVLLDCMMIPNAKISLGRVALAYGQHRVVGTVGWSNVGRSLDAALLKIRRGPHWLDIAYSKLGEDLSVPGRVEIDDGFGNMISVPGFVMTPDVKMLHAYGHLEPGDLPMEFEPFVIHMEKDPGEMALTSLGNYMKYTRDRFKLQQDFVFQTGTMRGTDVTGWLLDAELAVDVSPEGDGRFGVVGGYSLYTGDKAGTDDVESYQEILPTGHKFHGFMDLAPGLARFGGRDHGLQDIYGKVWAKLPADFKAKAAFHVFSTEQDVEFTNNAGAAQSVSSIGNELDLVIGRKMENGLHLEVGGGVFLPSDVAERGASDTENALWGYLQGTVPF